MYNRWNHRNATLGHNNLKKYQGIWWKRNRLAERGSLDAIKHIFGRRNNLKGVRFSYRCYYEIRLRIIFKRKTQIGFKYLY